MVACEIMSCSMSGLPAQYRLFEILCGIANWLLCNPIVFAGIVIIAVFAGLLSKKKVTPAYPPR